MKMLPSLVKLPTSTAMACFDACYTTWCLLATSVVEVLDFRRGDGDDDDAGGTRHLSVSFFPPGAEDALRAGAS